MRIFARGWSSGLDGPGRRWVIYLKGCNMHCPWCSNPESIRVKTEILFFPNRGGLCDGICPYGGLSRKNGEWKLEREFCSQCSGYPCVSVHCHPAFSRAGEYISVEEILDHVQEIRPLFSNSGGVTFGGGEATLQAKELINALRELSKINVHTAVESNAATLSFPSIVPETDLLLCDLKSLSKEKLHEWTGGNSDLVRKNLMLAAGKSVEMVIRIPLVPGFNTDNAERDDIADFLKEIGILRPDLKVEVLRMHHGGAPKWRALGHVWSMEKIEIPGLTFARQWTENLRKVTGLDCRVIS